MLIFKILNLLVLMCVNKPHKHMLLWLSANPSSNQKGIQLNKIMCYWFARAVYCTVIFTYACPSTPNSLPRLILCLWAEVPSQQAGTGGLCLCKLKRPPICVFAAESSRSATPACLSQASVQRPGNHRQNIIVHYVNRA